jgi:hypothetical protein
VSHALSSGFHLPYPSTLELIVAPREALRNKECTIGRVIQNEKTSGFESLREDFPGHIRGDRSAPGPYARDCINLGSRFPQIRVAGVFLQASQIGFIAIQTIQATSNTSINFR